MRTSMFVLIAVFVFTAAVGPFAPHKAWTKDPKEAGAKQGARAEERSSPNKLPEIVATNPTTADVVVTQQYHARINAQRHLKVRALTTGVLEAIRIREGRQAKQGDVLFKLSSTALKAKLEIESTEVEIAQHEFAFAKKLSDEKVVAQSEVNLSDVKLKRAKAKLELAQVELDCATITAPFDGLLGRIENPEGSRVVEGDILTTLSDNSVMWVYFDVPERVYLELMAEPGRTPAELRIGLLLADGRKFPQIGKIAAIEADFNSATGNISFRADFPNPDRLLRHGQFGTVSVDQTVKNALVIPQRAAFEILDRRCVYVVDDEGVARRREIAVRHELDNTLVIEKGLDVGDRIVVDGLYRIRDGEKIEYTLRKPAEVGAAPTSDRAK